MVHYPRRSPHFLACRQAVRSLAGPVVVGVSGGADSLALAAALSAEHIEAHAVIVDHQLQPGSAEVARQAASQVEKLGLTADIVTVTVPTGGDGMEAEARRVRYHALGEVAGDRPVVVGHTADDQAETFLIGALRGIPTGMVTMVDTGQLVRPFLQLRRATTQAACQELGVEFWEDPHNYDPAFLRVGIRTQIVPALDTLTGTDAVGALATTADKIAADNALLNELAGPPTDDCTELAAQPEPLRRRRIIAWLHSHGLPVNDAVIGGVDKLCTQWHGQGGVAVGHEAGRRVMVRRVQGRLQVG